MVKKMIRLSSIADVRDFVNAVASYDGDIDLKSGRYIVDGKSIMGIFSLDLLDPIELTVRNDDTADVLIGKIQRFLVD